MCNNCSWGCYTVLFFHHSPHEKFSEIFIKKKKKKENLHANDPKVGCYKMWNECDIIEAFHTEEHVKHLFPTRMEIVFNFYLVNVAYSTAGVYGTGYPKGWGVCLESWKGHRVELLI